MAIALITTALMIVGPLMGVSDEANAIISLLAGLSFTLMHGSAALGFQRLLIFLGITVVLSFTSEAVGVATGLIFGNYHYTDLLGPKLLGVPLMIQVGYVSMGYASLITARVILGCADVTPRGWNLVKSALVGAFTMVAWDVSLDPLQSTVAGDWLWHDGGGYFGVPLHNYAGWFGTVFLFMLLYLGYETKNPLSPAAGIRSSALFWSGPVIYYALMGLQIVFGPIVEPLVPPIASPANYTGTLVALEQSLSLIAIFTMGGPVLMAVCRLTAPRDPS